MRPGSNFAKDTWLREEAWNKLHEAGMMDKSRGKIILHNSWTICFLKHMSDSQRTSGVCQISGRFRARGFTRGNLRTAPPHTPAFPPRERRHQFPTLQTRYPKTKCDDVEQSRVEPPSQDRKKERLLFDIYSMIYTIRYIILIRVYMHTCIHKKNISTVHICAYYI